MRRFLTRLFRTLLEIFFQRIEVVGAHHVPESAPTVVAVNHPNGLVDPLFVFAFVPRRVSFLAKAPLFHMPVIGWFVRTLESVPVYRKQDNVTGTTAETFAIAREILGRGGAIAIFPEGTTHSDTRLRNLKTGAARIALGSSLPETTIVPAGIYYTEKQTFRSKALIAFGEPIAVRRTTLTDGEPPVDAVRELTDELERGLDTLTLQADSHAALDLIAHAEDIFTADGDQPLSEELELRRRFIAGYRELRERDPDRLARLESEIRRFAAELGRRRMEPHELTPHIDARTIARVVVLFPIAAAGAVIHYIPYRIVDGLSRRFSREASELTATVKFIAALAIYPLGWIAFAVVAWMASGPAAAFLTLVALPLLGFSALHVMEDLDDAIGRTRAVIHSVFSRDSHAALLEQRRGIRREIAALGEELGVEGATAIR